MDREALLALPMTRAVSSTIGNAAAWAVNDMIGGGFPRHRVPQLGANLMRDLMAMPEAARAHLAALLMHDNREPMQVFGVSETRVSEVA